MRSTLFFLVFAVLTGSASAQETIVRGRITDATTNEPIPFANARFQGTTSGTACDFDGFYSIKTTKPIDSLTVSYLGYKSRTKRIKRGQVQTIDFQLQSDAVGLKTVTILAGENPAYRIIRKAIANKETYNYQKLEAYEAESYVKILVDVDQLSERFKKRKILKPVTALFDSLQAHAGEDGKAHLPVFYSENLSKLYYTKSPEQKREDIIAAKINAVGLKKGGTLSQLTGSSFEEYNFNNDRIALFTKEFLSPIATSAFLFYEYYLIDSSLIGAHKCYQIKVKPKNNQDLLFTGNIWITDTSFAVKQINLDVSKTANLNFIEKMQIQQELALIDGGIWFPVKTRSVVDFRDVSNNTVGLIGKFYVSYKDVKINQAKDAQFYQQNMVVAEGALRMDNDFWAVRRHEKLTATDVNMYNMLDTVRNLPTVRTLVDIAYTLVNGYYELGKIGLGPYHTIYRFNNIEGNKLRLGFRTNERFSREWILRGYLGYGTKDEKFKYNMQVERILSRKVWTKAGMQYRDDIDPLGFSFNYDDSPSFTYRQSSLFAASSQINRFSLLTHKREQRIWLESEFRRGLTGRVALYHGDFKQFFDVNFDPGSSGAQFQKDFNTAELVTDLRIAPNEYNIQSDNRRIRLSQPVAPVILLTYTMGVKGIVGSSFNYHKLGLGVRQKLRLGLLGFSEYYVDAGKVLSPIPYTLLEIHRGNQTPFFANGAYNLMNYFEFVSDQYVSIDYQHHFGGLLFNRIPLLRKLKLREVALFNAVYGGLSKQNRSYNDNRLFNTLSKGPYVEAGVGIENLFSLIYFDFIWRLSYTDAAYRADYTQLQLDQGINRPYHISTFGVKVGLQFAF